MKYRPQDIFTPQGILEEVEKNPNLDFLMNIFNIPRAFGVSGFGGGWNVGMHVVATSFIAFYWARFNRFDKEKTNRLVKDALLHDVHEAVTGDILPMFKMEKVKEELEKIQSNILKALGTEKDISLSVDLKIIDLTAFLYEIKQVSPSILNPKRLKLAKAIAKKQENILLDYANEHKVNRHKIRKFLKLLDL